MPGREVSGLHRFVVIGAPGAGKSTMLNEIADKDLFVTSSSSSSCTKISPENEKRISIQDGLHTHVLELVDTPGFPDTEPEEAAQLYDHVVEKCNGAICGVVFVLKPERAAQDLMEKYATLLREFTRLEVPLIMVLNGCEVKARRETADQWEQRKAKGVRDFARFGKAVEKAAGFHAREILVSFCLDDLTHLGKDIARVLVTQTPRTSKVRSFRQVLCKLESCTSTHEAAAEAVGHANAAIRRCEDDIASLREEISTLQKWAAGTGWIPFAGWAAAAILLAKVSGKHERIAELQQDIDQAREDRARAGDVGAMQRAVARAKQEADALGKYLQRAPRQP